MMRLPIIALSVVAAECLGETEVSNAQIALFLSVVLSIGVQI